MHIPVILKNINYAKYQIFKVTNFSSNAKIDIFGYPEINKITNCHNCHG
jgi:hypothetical protein